MNEINKCTLSDLNFDGLNLNPITLEFGQSMTTTKWLGSILSKLNQVLEFTKKWYDVIIKDLEEHGELFELLSKEVKKEFGEQITQLEKTIQILEYKVKELEYKKPYINTFTVSGETEIVDGNELFGANLRFILENITDTTKCYISKDGVVIDEITPINGMNRYLYGETINTTTFFDIRLQDQKNTINSDKIQFNFYKKAYYGEKNTIEELPIIKKENIINYGKLTSYDFNSNKYIYFLIPQEYNIKIFYNDKNVNDGFNIELKEIDNNIYKVFTSNNLLIDDEKITFRLERK